jgi:asparagine synthase (glutamine-hydrolysing)
MRKDGRPVTAQTLDPIYRAMAAWGPDGYRTWHKGSVGLGHLRLCITPASHHDRQPLPLSSGSPLVITADARIDNRADVMARLGVPRERWSSFPDSAVILRAYERWGPACVKELVGAFAFVIWDAWTHTLVCGRDHMGFRPLIYVDTPRFFVFASDIKGVLAYPLVPQTLNYPLLAAALQQTTFQAEKRLTFYQDVVKLPPAHRLVVAKGKTKLDRYWAPADAPDVRLPSDEAYAGRLRELLEEAVRCRVRTPYLVGSHLSGGMDSSSVTALAARELHRAGRSLDAFSWSPPPEAGRPLNDERADVEAVRRRAGIACYYHAVTPEDVIRTYGRDFTVEPTEMLIYEEWAQRQAARSGIRVMLSGWGGDEVVTSHTRCYYAELLSTGRWCRLHRELAAASKRNLSTSRWARAKRYGRLLVYGGMAPLLPDCLYGFIDQLGVNWPLPWSCVNPDFAHRYRREVQALRGYGYRDRPRVRSWEIHWLTLGHLTQRIEDWATSGARYGLSYSYPLLDKRLLTFCLGLPSHCLYQDGERRALFRRAMKGVLPERVRLKSTKDEPANIALAERLVPEGFCRLFEQMRPRMPNTPIAAYIDIARLQTVLIERDPYKLRGGIIPLTVACMGVGMIATGRPWGYLQSSAYTYKEDRDERSETCTESKATVGHADSHRDRYPVNVRPG